MASREMSSLRVFAWNVMFFLMFFGTIALVGTCSIHTPIHAER